MKTTESDSGLILPVQKPEPPKRTYGPLEIQDAERRKEAREAIKDLWDAMQLTNGSLWSDSKERYDAHYRLWHYVGEMLLGEDCPKMLVHT